MRRAMSTGLLLALLALVPATALAQVEKVQLDIAGYLCGF